MSQTSSFTLRTLSSALLIYWRLYLLLILTLLSIPCSLPSATFSSQTSRRIVRIIRPHKTPIATFIQSPLHGIPYARPSSRSCSTFALSLFFFACRISSYSFSEYSTNAGNTIRSFLPNGTYLRVISHKTTSVLRKDISFPPFPSVSHRQKCPCQSASTHAVSTHEVWYIPKLFSHI